jgi:HD-like signal output (HDOD) protein
MLGNMSNDFQSIINAVGDLPPIPIVATKVMQLMQDHNSTAKKLADAISKDAAVSARILKIANSSFYSMQRQVKTMEHAIVILGEKTLKSLVLASSLKGLNKTFGLMEKMLWEDSIGGAIGARIVAQRFHSADPEEAFLGGLFRHIGLLVMNNMDRDKFQQIIEGVYNGEGSFEELERERFPYSHAVIGEALLKKWNFSENLTQVARHHDDLFLSRKDNPDLYKLVVTVYISDKFCRHLGIGQRMPDEQRDLYVNLQDKAPGLKAEHIDKVLEEFKCIFERDRDAFFAD